LEQTGIGSKCRQTYNYVAKHTNDQLACPAGANALLPRARYGQTYVTTVIATLSLNFE